MIGCPSIYGPVTSRRHGSSLGINLGSPKAKICTWSCLYCQCGFGERRRLSPFQDSVPARAEIMQQLRTALADIYRLDSITFAGNSEPGQHSEFFEIVQDVLELRKELKRHWVVNGLSNGSELDIDRVVHACDALDEVWIKLDCGTDELFRRLNRPLPSLGGVEAHIHRIQRLKQPRIQTLVWQAENDSSHLSNWTPENREALIRIYEEIRPTEIHIMTISRKTAFAGLLPVASDELEAFTMEVRSHGIAAAWFS